jgi:hypothetical protein
MQKCDRKNILVFKPDQNYSETLVQNLTWVTMELPIFLNMRLKIGTVQYTLSIITSQLHCFQLRTTCNGKDFKFFSHGLYTDKQNILLQYMHENEFFILSNKCGTKLKHENEAPGHNLEPVLLFVLMLISIFIDQNPKFFSHMWWRRMFCFSMHSPLEKTWNPFH